MADGVPSGVGMTAIGVAYLRALESRRVDPWFEDPLAAAACEAAGWPLPEDGADLELPGAWGPMPRWISLRTRFLDEVVLDAVGGGVDQVVVLAAGLDARAFRLDLPAGTGWWELDLPEMVSFKESAARAAGLEPRCERRTLVADVLGGWPVALEGAGWSPERPTCWLVEGLLVYLERDDAELLVGRVGELSPPGSRLAIVSSSESRVRDRSGEAATDAIVGLWRSGVPDDVTTWLGGHGWTAHDVDPVELTARYGRPGWVDADTVGAPKLVDARRR
jgi:methyltransferase (TIGR00027 family)